MHGSRPSSRAPQSHHSSRAPGSIRSQGPPAPPLPPQGSIYSAQAYSKGGVTQPASERFTPSPYAANGSKVMPPVGGTRSGPGMGGSKVGSAATGASKGSSVGQQLASVGRYLDPCSRK